MPNSCRACSKASLVSRPWPMADCAILVHPR
jgi:hypothetical protein